MNWSAEDRTITAIRNLDVANREIQKHGAIGKRKIDLIKLSIFVFSSGAEISNRCQPHTHTHFVIIQYLLSAHIYFNMDFTIISSINKSNVLMTRDVKTMLAGSFALNFVLLFLLYHNIYKLNDKKEKVSSPFATGGVFTFTFLSNLMNLVRLCANYPFFFYFCHNFGFSS